MAWQFVRTIVLLVGLVLLVPLSLAQVQRKPKGPKPPSYDEVMQRALSEKKAATNAPAATTVVPRVEHPAANSAAPPTVAQVEVEVKAPSPPPAALSPAVSTTTATPAPPVEVAPATVINAAPVVAPPVVPVPVVRAESPPPAAAPAPVAIPETAKVSKPQTKGPVFSPLPPDLAPTNELAKGKSPAAVGVTSDSTNAMEALDDKHLLAIGDRLSFRIVEDEEDPRALTVTDSGELEVPHIGRFAAAGKSCKELARALKAELEKEYYYRATVILAVDLMARSRGKVYLVGPVRMPGPQEIPSDEVLTLSKAILRAGGFTDFADRKNVKVTRKGVGGGLGDQTFTVNVETILERGKTEADLPLLPGDLIYIPERLVRF